MAVDLDDPSMLGYQPLDAFISESGDQSSRRIRSIKDMKYVPTFDEAPDNVEVGCIYYDTVLNKFRGKTATSWVDFH